MPTAAIVHVPGSDNAFRGPFKVGAVAELIGGNGSATRFHQRLASSNLLTFAAAHPHIGFVYQRRLLSFVLSHGRRQMSSVASKWQWDASGFVVELNARSRDRASSDSLSWMWLSSVTPRE